jgi:hypothetical protein
MAGTIVIIAVLFLVAPVAIIMGGGLVSAILATLLQRESDTAHKGSELWELSEK